MAAEHHTAACDSNTTTDRCVQFVLDEDGTIVGCDPSCEQLFSAPERELVGRHISGLVPKLAATRAAGGWLSPSTLFLSHCDIPFRTRRVDGTPFMSALYFRRFIENDIPRITVLVRDVSTAAHCTHDRRTTGADWCLE